MVDEIKSNVDAIVTFPEETEEPIVREIDSRRQVIDVAISGQTDEGTLKALAERVRDDLAANPEITQVGSATEEDWEGCLSIPEIRGRVPRAADIRVRALDRHGKQISMTATGFPARVIQHETDHLDGVLFFDRMESFRSLTFLEEYSRYWSSGDG